MVSQGARAEGPEGATRNRNWSLVTRATPPGPPGSARQRDPGPAHNAQSGSPRQPGDVSTGGDPGGHDPTSARAQDVHAPWAWSMTKRVLAKAAKGEGEALGPGTCAFCWVWDPQEASRTARGERRPKSVKQGGRRSQRPSVPHAGRPTSGPVSPGACLGFRGIPRATYNVGSCLVSPPSTRARGAPPGRRAGLSAKPRSTPAHRPTAEWGPSRNRGASLGPPAARPTPPGQHLPQSPGPRSG